MTKKLVMMSLGVILLVFFYVPVGFTQSSEELEEMRKEIETLKEDQRAIRKELEAMKNLFRGRQLPRQQEYQNLNLSVDGSPFKGDKNAPITLIEFSDYQCPFCARHFRKVFPKIESDYIKTGKVKYVFRDFPIESIHREAFRAAEAANCAGEQGRYWEMHDRLFANQNALRFGDLFRHSRALGLNLANFQKCLASGKQAAEIRRDIADAERAGVRGTPIFFLGRTQPSDSTIKALRVIRGAQPYASFKESIDSLLAIQR